MRVSEFLNFPPKFIQNEKVLFDSNESSNLINFYQSMENQQLSVSQKINEIIEIIKFCEISKGIEKKKIICLVMFSIFQTLFGRSIIQENEKFRIIVFNKYEAFIEENDDIFVEEINKRKI